MGMAETNLPFRLVYIDSSLKRTDQELLYQGPRGQASASLSMFLPGRYSSLFLKRPGGGAAWQRAPVTLASYLWVTLCEFPRLTLSLEGLLG